MPYKKFKFIAHTERGNIFKSRAKYERAGNLHKALTSWKNSHPDLRSSNWNINIYCVTILLKNNNKKKTILMK